MDLLSLFSLLVVVSSWVVVVVWLLLVVVIVVVVVVVVDIMIKMLSWQRLRNLDADKFVLPIPQSKTPVKCWDKIKVEVVTRMS